MLVILVGMGIAFFMILYLLPSEVTLGKAIAIAGHAGKMEVIDFSFDPSNRYTIWSGILGGLFLHASYFGTDQSQVQRYLGGKSVAASRMGLLFNALFKIPMQFLILLTGVLVYVFYLFIQPPIFFNNEEVVKIQNSQYSAEFKSLNEQNDQLFKAKKEKVNELLVAMDSQQAQDIQTSRNELRSLENKTKEVHQEVTELMIKNDDTAETQDADYMFISFITKYLPHGVIGLLIAVIFFSSNVFDQWRIECISSYHNR